MKSLNKVIIIPDSFKGTLSSQQVCNVINQSVKNHFPNAQVISLPVADGGEGSVDCFLSALGGKKIFCECSNPYFEKMQGFYGLIQDGTAVIEMACCAGLPLVEDRKNPLLTTTFGVGELIIDALKRGVKKIIMGLGGSCTNDFGCGCACALGVKFFDKQGNQFIPTGATLCKIDKIDVSGLSPMLNGVQIITMCDIDNPPFGINGASYIFAPQKGADETQVELLDKGVKHACQKVKECLNKDLCDLAGGGAAGAMGAGMVAFFDSELRMGISTVLQVVDFENLVKDADLVFTGEGKIDGQSLRGKVVLGVAQSAKKFGVPVIAIVGGSEGDLTQAYQRGVTAVFSINRLPQDLSISKNFSQQNLAFTVDNILRTLQL